MKVNSNAFRLNFFALFEIFWLHMSANLICKQTGTVYDVTTHKFCAHYFPPTSTYLNTSSKKPKVDP